MVRQLNDQRPATMPVTFALTTLLLREHNRCCDEFAYDWGAMNDQVKATVPVILEFNVGHRDNALSHV